MVLSTTGASWSLEKGKSSTTTGSPFTSRFPTGSKVTVTNRNAANSRKTLGLNRSRQTSTSEEDFKETQEPESGMDVDIVTDSSNGRHGKREVESVPETPPKKGKHNSKKESVIVIGSSDEEDPLVAKSNVAKQRPSKQRTRFDIDLTDVDDIPSSTHTKQTASARVIDLTAANAVEDEQDVTQGSTHTQSLEIERIDGVDIAQVTFDLEKITKLWEDAASSPSFKKATASDDVEKNLADEVEVDDTGGEGAEELLSRVIQKEDFMTMDILGQFNLGFIIVRSRRRAHVDGTDGMDLDEGVNSAEEIDDLFIVDQHAADEKYNFETLQQTTKIESQKLIRSVLGHHLDSDTVLN
jgi:DNA mismatch repair protein PMS2